VIILQITKEELDEAINDSIHRAIKAYVHLLKQQNGKPHLNVVETAKLLNVSTSTVYRLTSTDNIPFYKRNRRVYFKRAELIDWIASGRKESN